MLQKLDHNVTMNNFNFHLSWHDKTIIHADGRQNEGWLANMEAVDIAKEIRDIDYALITVNKLGWKRGDEEGSTKVYWLEYKSFAVDGRVYNVLFVFQVGPDTWYILLSF